MRNRTRQAGISLAEMTIVIAIVALLAGISIPAIRSFFGSFESQGSARPLISAALASARALAAKEQKYAGIRFQMVYDSADQLRASQYMIFIVHDFEKTGLQSGFRAAEGVEPIKLPDVVGVMDMFVRDNIGNTDIAARDTVSRDITAVDLDDTDMANYDGDDNNLHVTDATSFSIIFSPSGRLIVHEVRVRNKHKKFRAAFIDSQDDIFNGLAVCAQGRAMFLQDDYAHFGLGAEYSRNSFVIYDRSRFAQMNGVQRYNYLHSLDVEYINPYIGTIVSK